MPKVSIIIPVYNVEKYLRQCLDSVVNQTLKDIEIICVNDGSTDNSLQILKEYADSDRRIKIIEQKENQGQGVAKNLALETSIGEYVCFVDSDDWLELDALQTLYDYANKNNADYVEFLLNRYDTETKSYENIKQDYSYHEDKIYTNADMIKNLFAVPIYSNNKLLKREFLKTLDIKFFDFKLGEDHIVTIKSRLFANRICFLNKVFYHYRRNKNSSTNIESAETINIFQIIDKTKKYLEQNYENFEELQPQWEEYIYNFQSWNVQKVPKNQIKIFYSEAKRILPARLYLKFLYNYKIKTFVQQIFSIKNDRDNKHKVVTILGLRVKIKVKKK